MLIGDENSDAFDTDLIVHINMALSELNQLGVGPSEGIMITGDSETWNMITDNKIILGFVKTFVNLKVKSIFDPSTSSAAMDSMNQIIKELEWRLQVQSESPETSEPGGEDIDYIKLINKPSINGIELIGNKTNEDLNIFSISSEDIDDITK